VSPAPSPSPAKTAEDQRQALPAGTRFGELEILRTLGIGGFGIVYLARDHALERDVAIKEFMPAHLAWRSTDTHVSVRTAAQLKTFESGRRSFVNEARLLARFDHPSLLKVYRFWEDHGTAYMAMPYLQGQTLSAARKALGRAPDEAWIRQRFLPLLDALALRDALRDRSALNAQLARYADERRRHVSVYQFWSRWLTPLFQSATRWPAQLRDLSFLPAGKRWPGKGLMLRVLSGTQLGWVGQRRLPADFLRALEERAAPSGP